MVVAEGGVLRNVKRDECNPAEGSRQEGDESPCRQHIPEGTSVSFAASDPPVRALVASVHVPHPRGRENEEGKRSEGRPMNQHLGTHEQTSEHAEKKQSPCRRVAEPLQLVIELSKEPDLVRRARRARRACSCGRHRTRRGLLGTPTCLHCKQSLEKICSGRLMCRANLFASQTQHGHRGADRIRDASSLITALLRPVVGRPRPDAPRQTTAGGRSRARPTDGSGAGGGP